MASFQEALSQAAAAPSADRVFLGADVYKAPTTTGFDYLNPNAPVEIVGQGTGQTILTGPSGSNPWVLRLVGAPGASIHDLTIRLPQNVVSGFSGLHTRNAARRIEVIDEDPTQANARYGVDLVNGGTLEDSSVTLGGQQPTAAVILVTPDVAVRRSTLSARTGAESYGGTIERSSVTGAGVGLFAYRNLTAITGSLIRATGPTANVIFAQSLPGSSTTVNADGATIIGPGLPNTFGVGASDEPAPENVSINLTNAIIRGVSAPLFAAGSGGGHQVKVAASYSDYDPSGSYTVGADASIIEANVSNLGDARFADAAGGDYHLRLDSPLVDAGDPATPQGLDLDGNPLVADGNGDGSARRDMGAYEVQPAAGGSQPPVSGSQPPGGGASGGADTQAPLVSGFKAAPSLFAVARAGTPLAARLPRGTRFRYTLSEAAQVKLTIGRRLAGQRARYRTTGTLKRTGAKGANRIRFTGRIGKRSLRPGRYRAVIAATDAAGNRSTQSRIKFRVAAN